MSASSFNTLRQIALGPWDVAATATCCDARRFVAAMAHTAETAHEGDFNLLYGHLLDAEDMLPQCCLVVVFQLESLRDSE